MIFKRRREDSDESQQEPGAEAEATDSLPAAEGDAGGELPTITAFDRSSGPYDIEEVDEPDAMVAERIDLGCVQIPLIEGLEIRVEIDQASNTPMGVTLIHGPGAVQVRAFAGPRTGGTWGEAIGELQQQVTADGGTVDQAEGPFGTELRATVPAQDEQGNQGLQRIRIVGVDGPRWMLQGVLLGAGADPIAAATLENIFRGVVVVRGDLAMPMGAVLPIVLPQQVPGDVEHDGMPVLDEDELQ